MHKQRALRAFSGWREILRLGCGTKVEDLSLDSFHSLVSVANLFIM